MSSLRYHVDERLVPADEAVVSVRDRGFMYGDAAFETLRVYGGTPFRWQAHADRLARTVETLGFAGSLPPSENLRKRVIETLSANEFEDAYVRLSVTRGVQPGKLSPDETVEPTIVVIVKELPRGGTDGDAIWEQPARVQLVETRRIPDSAVPAAAKTHNYLNGILARLELRESATDEAIMCTVDGHLTEGATSNLFTVHDGQLKTPTDELPLLPGITREVVVDVAEKAEIPVETGRYTPELLERADEIFLTNSTWEIRPVTRVGEHKLSVGPVTERLQKRFDELVETLYHDER